MPQPGDRLFENKQLSNLLDRISIKSVQDIHARFLGDKEIGFHKFMVTPHKDQTYVSSEANFDVKFLFISAYTYLHQNSEVWKGDCLQAINATTDDNGDTLFVRGKYRDQGLNLQTHNGQQNLEGCVKTFAYWDPSLLKSNKFRGFS